MKDPHATEQAHKMWTSLSDKKRHDLIQSVGHLNRTKDPQMTKKMIELFWPFLSKKWAIQWNIEQFTEEVVILQGISDQLIMSQHELDSANEHLIEARELRKISAEKNEKTHVWSFLRFYTNALKNIRENLVPNFIIGVLTTCFMANSQLLAKRDEPEPTDATGLTTEDLESILF